ncbi:MAG: hypothetical protein HEP70_18115 [Rhodobiaceae bacterium]|nr:hypothetical protein [Rhodobiaceae bacterium]
MSLLVRRRAQAVSATIVLSLFLSACGFTPLYATRGQNESIVTLLATISVQASGDRVGRALRVALEDKLGSNATTQHQYGVVLESRLSEIDVAVQQDTEVTRQNLRLNTEFYLSNAETGEVIYFAKSNGTVAFNRVASEFANIIAERDAQERVANQVAEDIHSKLAIYFQRQQPN